MELLLLLGVLMVAGGLGLISMASATSRRATGDSVLESVVWMSLPALSGGLRLVGGSGSGKTVLAAALAFNLWLYQCRSSYIFDPTGSFLASFLSRFKDYCEQQQVSEDEIARLESRIKVYELGADSGHIMRSPQCQRFPGESMTAAVERILAWVLAGRPESQSAAIMGWSSLEKILTPYLYLAMALNLALTELADLLQHPKSDEWKLRYQLALERYPRETREAVNFWQKEYSSWDKATRRQAITIVESFLKPYRYNEPWRASLGATVSDFDDEHFIATGTMVFFIGGGQESIDQRQMLDWHVRRFLAYIRLRGSGHHHEEVGFFIDEPSLLYTPSDKGMEMWAQLIGEAVQVLKRQYQIHPLVVLHQSQSQLHPLIAHHFAALGQVVGKAADYESALELAPQVFDQRPVLKYWEPVLMHIPNRGIEVVNRRPVEYARDEVLQQQAEILLSLDRFKFLCRLSPYKEGGRRTELQQLDFSPFIGSFPDAAWVKAKREQLAKKSGVPIEEALADIDGRLKKGMNQQASSATLAAVTPSAADDQSQSTDTEQTEHLSDAYVPGAAFRLRPAAEDDADDQDEDE